MFLLGGLMQISAAETKRQGFSAAARPTTVERGDQPAHGHDQPVCMKWAVDGVPGTWQLPATKQVGPICAIYC